MAENSVKGNVTKVEESLSATAAATAMQAQESASATMLDIPGTYTRLQVYSDMNARWPCSGPDNGGDTLLRAKISNLWLVHSWKGLLLRWEQKCLIPETVASSSLSNVE
jgi:hypothetical protein